MMWQSAEKGDAKRVCPERQMRSAKHRADKEYHKIGELERTARPTHFPFFLRHLFPFCMFGRCSLHICLPSRRLVLRFFSILREVRRKNASHFPVILCPVLPPFLLSCRPFSFPPLFPRILRYLYARKASISRSPLGEHIPLAKGEHIAFTVR